MTERIKEIRAFEIGDLRADKTTNGDMVVGGLGIPYNRDSLPIFGMFKEQIAPGAFSRSLNTGDVKFFSHHDPSTILARTGNGSLKLTDSDRGILFDVKFLDTGDARDLFKKIEARLLTGMSFGFFATRDRFVQAEGDEIPTRIVEEGELIEQSVVTFPAYPDSTVAKRAFDEWQTSITNVMNAAVEADWRARMLQLQESN